MFITGGSQGIGLGLARAFGRHGARVTIASRKEEHLSAAAAQLRTDGIEAAALAFDVRDRPAVESAAQAIAAEGGVDVVVNNAAGNFAVPFAQMSENAWDAVVNIVLNGTANVCRSFGRVWIRDRRPGVVLNIVAGYAWSGAAGVSHSGAAKAGVLNLTRSLAVEWAPHRIRVNAISPGAIEDTGGARILVEQAGLADAVRRRVPLARFGTWDDITQAALYLASDAASYVTGALLVVDGGLDALGSSGIPQALADAAVRPEPRTG